PTRIRRGTRSSADSSATSAAARAMSASSMRFWRTRTACGLEEITVDAGAAVMNYPRRDARDKLRGRTRYTVDRAAPGMLHAAVLRSQVASAQIVKLDVSGAASMPGVRAVITASDAPGLHGIGIADHPLFASDRIRYHGEPLAAVAADTPEIAEAALRAIIVETAPLPTVVTMQEALRPGAPLVHPD